MADFWILLLTLAPWIELRGSIPLGIAAGLNPILVLVSAIALNVAVFFPIWIFLTLLYSHVAHWRFVRWATRKALKNKRRVEKWGIPGLAIFIAIPAPFTGVWTATLLAWLLRMSVRRTFAAVVLGVLGAAAIVFAVTVGAISGIKLFL